MKIVRLLGTAFFIYSTIANAQTVKPPVKQSYPYTTVPGDPLQARLYQLKNGLKVFLSVYKDEPRFQSMIGVKAAARPIRLMPPD